MHALLLTKENEIENFPSSHGGVKALFFRYFPEFKNYSKLIEKTYNLRYESDYKLQINVTTEEVEQLIKEVKKFYNKILEYLKDKGIISEKEIVGLFN